MIDEVIAQVVLKQLRLHENKIQCYKKGKRTVHRKFIYRIRKSVVEENYKHALRLLTVFENNFINKTHQNLFSPTRP